METSMPHNLHNTLQSFKHGKLYSLPMLGKALNLKLERLPVSIRIVLESVLRNCDGKKVTQAHVRQLAGWQPNAKRTDEIPFVLARIVLQDFTGVPLLCDLAAMRGVAKKMGKDPKVVEPLVPVDLVVDHSVQVDHYGSKNALDLNQKLEFKRNEERYQFMKWGMQAFDTFKVVPPGIGICHQVNLEYLAPGVHKSKDGVCYPDTLVGTDSHTTMINGIGSVGWGVGGIEAEAGMLGQPVYFLTPDVVGVELKNKLHPACTATDLVLTVTEMLRKAKVVGKFVEFFGEGTASLSVTDRATLGNMAPEYGATMGFFPVDERTLEYFRGTGRSDDAVDALASYYKAQGLFGIPKKGAIDYSEELELDLSSVYPSLAGPKRPQDRIDLDKVKDSFARLFSRPVAENGFAKKPEKLQDVRRQGAQARRRADRGDHLLHQYLEPRRPARRGAAGEEGGRARPDGQAAHQDVAGAGLARGHRIPRQGRAAALPRKTGLQPRRIWLHYVHRQFRAARAADRGGDRQERHGVRRGALGQPQLRSAHSSEHPRQLPRLAAAGGGVCACRLRAGGFQDSTARQGKRRERRVHRPHLADPGGDRRSDEAGDGSGDLPPPLLEPGRDQSAVEEDLRARRAGVQLAEVDLHRRAAVLPRFLDGARTARRHLGGHDPRHLRRLGDHRPHLPGRLDQAHLPGRHLPAGARRRGRRLQQLWRAAR